ncbi:hypothetical protein CEXT_207861 [Caerostris extrusa]|uniref:Uncharacterized protein n=1 Tax=Caerostris extrusa TaxID=172846 RepID=A0AAV4TJC6_CAEEX|nr:hypothetical protein CEXT_207861 [Caerostris extrusa]
MSSLRRKGDPERLDIATEQASHLSLVPPYSHVFSTLTTRKVARAPVSVAKRTAPSLQSTCWSGDVSNWTEFLIR